MSPSSALLHAAIPRSGELLPRLGLGTYQTFDVQPGSQAGRQLAKVLQAFHRAGGRLIDSSPMYGRSEATFGELASGELRVVDELFVATKVWTDDQEQGRKQMEASLQHLGRPRGLDLMQVHNLRDFKAHWPLLEKWKAAGKLRYIGISHWQTSAFGELERIMQAHQVDFVQVPYSLAETSAAQRLIPVAAQEGVAVIANEPFDQGNLFEAMEGQPVPAWAAELGIHGWAQYFLKWILGDERVQFVIPATGKLEHLEELLGGARGPLPNAAQRQRMQAELGELGRSAHS